MTYDSLENILHTYGIYYLYICYEWYKLDGEDRLGPLNAFLKSTFCNSQRRDRLSYAKLMAFKRSHVFGRVTIERAPLT